MTTLPVASPRFTFVRSHPGQSDPGRSYLALVWGAASAPMSLVLFGVSAVLVALGLTIYAALAVAVVAVPVYAAYLRETGSLELARSALVTITVDCGTLLVVFLSQPERRGDRRPRSSRSRWLRCTP